MAKGRTWLFRETITKCYVFFFVDLPHEKKDNYAHVAALCVNVQSSEIVFTAMVKALATTTKKLKKKESKLKPFFVFKYCVLTCDTRYA